MKPFRLALLAGAVVALASPSVASSQQLLSDSHTIGCFLMTSGPACSPATNAFFMSAAQPTVADFASIESNGEAAARNEEDAGSSPFSFMTSGMRPYIGLGVAAGLAIAFYPNGSDTPPSLSFTEDPPTTVDDPETPSGETGGNNPITDVVVTPEPLSMALLGTGLAGMGGISALRRRRNRR